MTAGLVIAGYGRQYLVRDESGASSTAVTRGKRTDVCVGDLVTLAGTAAGQSVIERVHARRNEFKRSDAWRVKRLATNIDQVAVVLAAEPPFSEELLFRVLINAAVAELDVLLVLNKCDLTQAVQAVEPRMQLYGQLGWRILRVSAKAGAQATRATMIEHLRGKTTLLLGQSGMGKSTLINLLVPDADLATRQISEALDSGRHTTTFSKLFDLPDAGPGVHRIIDSPGFQTFGLAHLSESEIAHAMPEVAQRLGKCRFNNCSHRDEPGCAISAAVAAGEMDARRHELFKRLMDEAESQRNVF